MGGAAEKNNSGNTAAKQGGQSAERAGAIQRQGAVNRQSPAKQPIAGNIDPCFNCNIVGHYAASCPTIRCNRCKKLGHIREICKAVIPWE